MQSDHARAVYSPLSISSFVAPAVRSSTQSKMMSHPASSGSGMFVSSKRTTPRRAPGGLRGVYGSTCFCPVSEIAHDHHPDFGPRSHARMRGFSPLLAVSYRVSSMKCEKFA